MAPDDLEERWLLAGAVLRRVMSEREFEAQLEAIEVVAAHVEAREDETLNLSASIDESYLDA